VDERLVEVQRWLSWNAYQFNPGGSTLYFEYIIKPRFNIGPVDEAEVKNAQATFRTYGAMLNEHLKSRRWLAGDTLTIADFSVAVTLPYAEKARIPLDEFPEMRRWHDQLNELDAWRNPFPQQHA
jgi:glutathione S-transferase